MAQFGVRSSQIACDVAARTPVTPRASSTKKLAPVHVAVAHLLSAGAALAESTLPALSDLQGLQDEFLTSAATTSAVSSAVSAAGDDLSPLIAGLAAGIAVAGGGLYAFTANSGPNIQTVSAAKAFDLLAEEEDSQLLDIRQKAELKEVGGPDLRSVKKSAISLPWQPPAPDPESGTVVIGWASKFARLRKIDEGTCVIVLDTNGTEAPLAAKLVAAEYPETKNVYCVAGGTDGPNGWLDSELPWAEPFKIDLTRIAQLADVDLSSLNESRDKLVEKYKENSDVVNAAGLVLGVAALSSFLFAELDTLLTLVGVIGVGQFIARKVLYAEDREETLEQLEELVTDRIAVKEAASDMRKIADTLLQEERTMEIKIVRSPEEVAAASNGSTTPVPADEPQTPPDVAEAREWISRWRS